MGPVRGCQCCSLQPHFTGSEASQTLTMKTGPFLEVNLIYQHPVLLDGLSLKNTVKEKL